MNIRIADSNDAEALCNLYLYHLTDRTLADPQDMQAWRERITQFFNDPSYRLLVGEVCGAVVSSVTLIVIDNLTHNMRPYALIENVVTHAAHRNRGYASGLLNHACGIAAERRCYKVMLMTGSKRESTLRFYRANGFDGDAKTAFVKWL